MAINYPVDVYNTLWSVYDVSQGQIIRRKVRWPVITGTEIPQLDDNIVWLLESQESRPDFDVWTQKLELTEAVDVAGNSVARGWQVVELTQEEQDALLPPHYTSDSGIKLDVSETAQAKFANFLVLINEAQMPETDMVLIKDVYGNQHGLSVADLRPLLVAYGLYCYQIFAG